ncbi:MAG: TFIIH/NER complex subunit [Watsoniomyces obsoletus]|nr:MAG: TFIIH/NER complex subunit [Watsoniomyces obsoletus]
MAETPTPSSRRKPIRTPSPVSNDGFYEEAAPSRSSRTSSRGSSNLNFDPDNEAVISTLQLETAAAQQPTRQRTDPNKYHRYDITDTSANAGPSARPGQSYGTAEHEAKQDDTSTSIEMGRGLKKTNRSASTRFRAIDTFDSDLLKGIGDDSSRHSLHDLANASERIDLPRTRPSGKNTKNQNNAKHHMPNGLLDLENKENEIPSDGPKMADHGSRGFSQGAGESKRGTTQKQARVDIAEDLSMDSDERLQTLDMTTRSTRFARTKGGATPAPAAFKTNRGGMNMRNASNVQKMESGRHGAVDTITTQHSYLMPDLPNLTELVSGVYQDGTPVFARHAATGSRFGGVNKPGDGDRDERNHAALESVPVPSEERAILVSLRLLQDKVAELEIEKADRERRIRDLERDTDRLRLEKQEIERRLRSDSALGMVDSGSDGADGLGKNKAAIKLHKSVKILQDRLDLVSQKLSTAEISIRNLTRERDSAVAQLGVAFYSSEELKQENQALVKENEKLKKQLARLNAENEDEKQRWAKRETALRKKLARSDAAVHEVRELTREIWELKNVEKTGPASQAGTQRGGTRNMSTRQLDVVSEAGDDTQEQFLSTKTGKPVSSRAAAAAVEKTKNMTTSTQATRGRKASAKDAAMAPSQRSALKGASEAQPPKVPTPKKRTRKVIVEETIHSEAEATNTGMVEEANVQVDQTVHTQLSESSSLTNLSFLDKHAIEHLQNKLEEERKRLRQGRARGEKTEEHPIRRTVSDSAVNQKSTVQRKSSLKAPSTRAAFPETAENTGNFSIKEGENTEHLERSNIIENVPSEHGGQQQRRASAGQRTRPRKDIINNNMTEGMTTSAFIIPDITIREPWLLSCPHGTTEHDRQSCTICRAHTTGNKTTTGAGIKIPKPIPVSERMPPRTSPQDEEPTIRPSQPPPIALAVVMKGLEDELSHLKIQLGGYQSAYSKHDASLSKSKRKTLSNKINELLKRIDMKADQIYALYDVLEGQKENGQLGTMAMMGNEDGDGDGELELTLQLQSIGLDINELGLGMGRGMATMQSNGNGHDDGDGEGETTREFRDVHAQRPVELDQDSSDDDEDDDSVDGELPWEGVDVTGDSTKEHHQRQTTRSRPMSVLA